MGRDLATLAAVVAAFIAGGFALWVASKQARAAGRGDRDTLKRSAYSRLLATTGLMVHTAGALRVAVEFRSGIKEGVDVATRIRKPADPLEVNAVIRRDLEPLYQSWAEVWTVGSPEAIRISNEMIGYAIDIVGAAAAPGEGRTGMMRFLAGDKWSQQQLDELNRQISVLAESRHEFGLLAREELGYEVAELFCRPGGSPGGAGHGNESD